MNINEFINLTRSDPNSWRNYCEIIIRNNGLIELARPSHTEKLIEIYCEIEHITRDEFIEGFPKYLSVVDFIVEKYKLICVWYDYMIRPEKINRFQQRTLEALVHENLISAESKYKIAREYSWYLNDQKRNSIKPDGKNTNV